MDNALFQYKFGSAEFDESRFELRVAGLPVDVENRALEVLAYLIHRVGEVVPKEELLREVWAGRITVDKVLPNAINKLRRALGEGNAVHICTHARLGYRFDGPVVRTAIGERLSHALALSPGRAVPGRPNFSLVRQLSASSDNEVWLAEQPRASQLRVYKFAKGAHGLRQIKREATLLRVLQDCPMGIRHFVELLDWNFETAPCFLECSYGGITLTEWADAHLSALDTPARISLFLQIADAVAAAHAVGVLHKDLKPANVLVSGKSQQPDVRLTDFGSGILLEPERLAELGITRHGMTVESGSNGQFSGTPLYIAPEHFEGHSPTVKSDVYSLGVLLYQILSGRVGLPMVSGWELSIEDELLREDVLLATQGDPDLRLSSVAELGARLRRITARRADRLVQHRLQQVAQREREALALVRARRPFVIALIAALALGIAVSVGLQQQAVSARNEAQSELERASALARFVNEDLIGRSNPLVSIKGPDTTLREVLLAVQDRIGPRFADQPLTAADMQGTLAALLSSIDLQPEAEAQARQALEVFKQHGKANSDGAVQLQLVFVRVLALRGKFDEAQVQLTALEQMLSSATSARQRAQLAAARSVLSIGRGKFVDATSQLQSAIQELTVAEPANAVGRDMLRLDLIYYLSLTNRRDEALAEGHRLMEEVQHRAGDNELLLALARLALARALGDDYAKAESHLLEAKSVIVARLGKQHKRYLMVLNELMRVTQERGAWPEALSYVQEMHEHCLAKYGAEHAATNVALLSWARVLSEAGRSVEAVDKIRIAHEKISKTFGPTSPRSQLAAVVRAQIELDVGNTDHATPLIQQLDVATLKSGHAIEYWGAIIDALQGIALQQGGHAVEARPLLEAAIAALKKEEKAEHPTRLYVMAQRARAKLG